MIDRRFPFFLQKIMRSFIVIMKSWCNYKIGAYILGLSSECKALAYYGNIIIRYFLIFQELK